MENKAHRAAHRKNIGNIPVTQLDSIGKYPHIASEACIVEISTSGLLLSIKRSDIIPKDLSKALNLDLLIGELMVLEIGPMGIDLDGIVKRTKRVDKDNFELAIDYSAGVPEYWRECLVDLMPTQEDLS